MNSYKNNNEDKHKMFWNSFEMDIEDIRYEGVNWIQLA
jgi:hypothetical protein